MSENNENTIVTTDQVIAQIDGNTEVTTDPVLPIVEQKTEVVETKQDIVDNSTVEKETIEQPSWKELTEKVEELSGLLKAQKIASPSGSKIGVQAKSSSGLVGDYFDTKYNNKK